MPSNKITITDALFTLGGERAVYASSQMRRDPNRERIKLGQPPEPAFEVLMATRGDSILSGLIPQSARPSRRRTEEG